MWPATGEFALGGRIQRKWSTGVGSCRRELRPTVTYIPSKDGLEAHEGKGDMEDRIRRYRQSPDMHDNREDTPTNVRSMRSAIIDGLHIG